MQGCKVVQAYVCRICVASTGGRAQRWGSGILVNNAGLTVMHATNNYLDALSKDDFRRFYEVKCRPSLSVLQAHQTVCWGWRLTEKRTGRSTVLNTSPIAGVRALGSSVAYGRSKGGLTRNDLVTGPAALGPGDPV